MGETVDYEALREVLREKLGPDKLKEAVKKCMEQRKVDDQVALLLTAQDNKIDTPTRTTGGTEELPLDHVAKLEFNSDETTWIKSMGIVIEVGDIFKYPKATRDKEALPFAVKGENKRLPCVAWGRECIDSLFDQLGGPIRVGQVYAFESTTLSFDTQRTCNSIFFNKKSQIRAATFEEYFDFNRSGTIKETAKADPEPAPAKEPEPEPEKKKEKEPEPIVKKTEKKAEPKKKKAEPKKEEASGDVTPEIVERVEGVISSVKTIDKGNIVNFARALMVEESVFEAALLNLVGDAKVDIDGENYKWVTE